MIKVKGLFFLAKEFSIRKENLIAFNACYTLEEILYLSNELNKYDRTLETVYIPSEERVQEREQDALNEQKRWGYRDGISNEEIESNFKKFKLVLQEIRDGLKTTFIKVKTV